MDIKSITSTEIKFQSSTEISSFNPDKRLDVNKNKDTRTTQRYDVDKRVDVGEKNITGGSYSDVKKNSDGAKHEVHHMPADSASKLERDDGPAIRMDKSDHRQTASCGNSREAREYRASQKELIENGKFRDALKMDIDDIRDKFGSKYDKSISEMLKYVDKIEEEGKI